MPREMPVTISTLRRVDAVRSPAQAGTHRRTHRATGHLELPNYRSKTFMTNKFP